MFQTATLIFMSLHAVLFGLFVHVFELYIYVLLSFHVFMIFHFHEIESINNDSDRFFSFKKKDQSKYFNFQSHN